MRFHLGFSAALSLASCAAPEEGKSTATGSAVTACMVSSQSVLARATPPDDVRGWIRIDSLDARAGGAAVLIDSDGYSLHARWTRVRDSLVIVAFNDFIRVEFRLDNSSTGARGTFRAYSDAALERDSTGALREFRRSGAITLRAASCDSLPTIVS